MNNQNILTFYHFYVTIDTFIDNDITQLDATYQYIDLITYDSEVGASIMTKSYMCFDPSKYKYYVDGNQVIAITHYKGRTIKGVATCSQDDTFDFDIGKKIAGTRAFYKICKRRLYTARAAYNKKYEEREIINQELDKVQHNYQLAQEAATHAESLKNKAVLEAASDKKLLTADAAIENLHNHLVEKCSNYNIPLPNTIMDIGEDDKVVLRAVWFISLLYNFEVIYQNSHNVTLTIKTTQSHSYSVSTEMSEDSALQYIKLFLIST